MSTISIRSSLIRSPFRCGLLITATVLSFGSLMPLPKAGAACQEGCDGFNTFLGGDALISNTTGQDNTATGAFALNSNTTGYRVTAIGSQPLINNTSRFANTTTGAFALAFNTA